MFRWDDAWLNRRTESPLDPGRPIVDAHHHLWVRDDGVYLVPQLQADTGGGHNVTATVYIDCGWGYRTDGPEHLRPIGETETVAAMAATSASTGTEIKAIVSHADMMLGDGVAEVLEAHVAAGQGRFRGIRHSTALDADTTIARTRSRPAPQMMGTDAFVAGVRRLGAMGLSFDSWLYHPQIPELGGLARAAPGCTIVLDHLGGMLGVGRHAGRRDEILAQWRLDIASLARCPNVNMKLGGIGMVTFGLGFENQPDPPTSEQLAEAWAGPILYAIEQFGPERCLFESNFPVDKLSCSYVTLWNAFKRIAAGASESEKTALFSATASAVYRL